jgi:SAM-dependent methyltransferase
MHYVNDLVLSELRGLTGSGSGPPAVAVDLGCGVGGTVSYLEQHLPATYYGITNSAVQQDIAARAAADRGSQATFRVDDHGDPELYSSRLPAGGVDLVYMIESFVHAVDPDVVIRGAAQVLRHGGRLVICDDLLTTESARNTEPVVTFRDGWHASGLLTERDLAQRAASVGLALRESRDLTSYVELRRPRDKVIRLIAPWIPRLGLRSPFWQNMHGGDALQRALLGGLIAYRYLVFEASSSSSESSGSPSDSSTRPFLT